MNFCPNCGLEIKNEDRFCSSCGFDLSTLTVKKTLQIKPPIVNNTKTLVCSIINVVIGCMPLGIVAIILSIQAPDAINKEDGIKKLKLAKVFNIIGYIIMTLFYLAYFFLLAILPFLVEQ